MKVSIIGTGYVGLVTGACLAEKGLQVVCVDVDESKVERINRGEPPIHERGLEPLLRRNIGSWLRATTDLHEAVLNTDLTLIAVGTPFDGRAIDLTQVKKAAEGIGKALKEKEAWHMVVVKSTVIPGTTDTEVLHILEKESGKRMGPPAAYRGNAQDTGVRGEAEGGGFGLGMNPEFLSEGEAVEDCLHPDRIVLGAMDVASLRALEMLYEGFPEAERISVNCRTAEMIKYASNSLLATLISFSNEFANLCAAQGGIDAMDVVHGLRASKYLSQTTKAGLLEPAPIADFLVPGCGFGGSCLPKDISALIAHARHVGSPLHILEAVRETNANQPARVTRLLEKHIHNLRGVHVAVLGLAFRPGTSDMRESPAIPIVKDLVVRGAIVSVYDPAVSHEDGGEAAKHIFEKAVRVCATLDEALDAARGVVIATRWDEFREVTDRLEIMADPPVVVDARRMLNKADIVKYEGIGL